MDASIAALPHPARLRRATFLRWLRRTHAWIGLWGALLGLCFGATGFLLNHRAVLKIPAVKNAEVSVRLELPALPESPQALARWAAERLELDGYPPRVKIEPPQTVEWGEQRLRQPERWQIQFDSPKRATRVEYWVGNRFAQARTTETNVFGVLTRLHMGIGAEMAWVLLADTIAGSVVLLSITGLLLWTRLHGLRLAAAGVGTGAVVVAALLVSASL